MERDVVGGRDCGGQRFFWDHVLGMDEDGSDRECVPTGRDQQRFHVVLPVGTLM